MQTTMSSRSHKLSLKTRTEANAKSFKREIWIPRSKRDEDTMTIFKSNSGKKYGLAFKIITRILSF